MSYKRCIACKHRCKCCIANFHGHGDCQGCDRFDEFKPAEHIIYCPMDGTLVELDQAVKYYIENQDAFSNFVAQILHDEDITFNGKYLSEKDINYIYTEVRKVVKGRNYDQEVKL